MELELQTKLFEHSKEILSWQDIEDAVLNIAEQIRGVSECVGMPEIIFALPRGGYVPAVMLSHLLAVPMAVSSTTDLETKYKDKYILIVDDISDTGDTFDKLHTSRTPKWATAAICYRGYSTHKPAFYAKKYDEPLNSPEHKWVVFPWESKEQNN